MTNTETISMKEFLWSIVTWIGSFLLISWLVEGGFWLHFYLSGAVSGSTFFTARISKLKKEIDFQRQIFEIADQQLVTVSAQVTDLIEKNDELERALNDLSHRLDSIENQ